MLMYPKAGMTLSVRFHFPSATHPSLSPAVSPQSRECISAFPRQHNIVLSDCLCVNKDFAHLPTSCHSQGEYRRLSCLNNMKVSNILEKVEESCMTHLFVTCSKNFGYAFVRSVLLLPWTNMFVSRSMRWKDTPTSAVARMNMTVTPASITNFIRVCRLRRMKQQTKNRTTWTPVQFNRCW